MSIALKTSRLTIKTPSLSDFDNWFWLLSDPQVMRYIGQGTLNKTEVQDQLGKAIQHHQIHGFTLGSVYENENHTFIGRAGLRYLYFDQSTSIIELGCALHKIHWKKGYATELLQGLINWGFDHLSLDKLTAQVDPKNLNSKNLIKKFNMQFVKNYLYAGKYEVERYELYKTIMS